MVTSSNRGSFMHRVLLQPSIIERPRGDSVVKFGRRGQPNMLIDGFQIP